MLFLGKIVKTRGNKGEVVYTSPGAYCLHDILNVGETVLLKSKKYQKELEIESLRELNGVLTVKFRGIDTINDALRLKGYSVYTARVPDTLPAEAGVTGFVVKDAGGTVWGTLEDLDTATLNQLMEIRGEDGEDIFYVPFNETIVKRIDREERLIIIDPPPGLKDLNRS